MRTKQDEMADVAILGSGFAGTMLAAILARQGLRVVLIDDGAHPRFAVGESTISRTTTMMQLIAERFSIPEIATCSSLTGITDNIASSCGIKRGFGFVYHREGEMQHPEEATQTVIPEFPHGPEIHLYRQDIDAYMLFVAIRYGAEVHQRTTIVEVQIDEHGVTLSGSRGECFTARYVVDASGFRSILTRTYDLRETPSRLKTHSRSLFTHMIGVKPYEECTLSNGMPRRWSEGTLHHLFDGGWMWVIPFNNHPHSTNPLCSVGLSLDSARFPKGNVSPQEEFEGFLARFPSIAQQFAAASPVRDWVSTDRLQYSSRQCVGDRFCLMAHASGFVDALFSRGLAHTTEGVYTLAELLLEAVVDGDFSRERFQPLEQLQQSLLDHNDRLVHCSYIAFSDFELWNAWYRVWALGSTLGSLSLNSIYRRYLETGDDGVLREVRNPRYPGSLCPDLHQYQVLFEAAAGAVEAAGSGHLSPTGAATQILDLLRQADFVPPAFNLGVPSRRYLMNPTLGSLFRILLWSKLSAPQEVKPLFETSRKTAFSFLRSRLRPTG